MGAGEYYGSNVNGDHFEEAGLIHKPSGWTGDPLVDKALGKNWTYGFPTFYNAYPYMHHRNKDPSRAYGEVEMAVWNDHMKRVELVCRVDHDKCVKFGGISVWDKLSLGQFPDVSMGCFKAGTLVTMADGTRQPIEDVQVGEYVLTHKGRARQVRATSVKQYTGTTYTIKPEAHPSFTCTEKHPLYCALSDQVRHPDPTQRRWANPTDVDLAPAWLPAKELAAHDLIEPVLQGEQAPDYVTREFARLFGYYLAEGHILRNKHGKPVGIQFSTHVDDAIHKEIEELCVSVGTDNRPTWLPSANSAFGKNVYLHDAWVAKKFMELGGSGAKTKRLAQEVLHWPVDLQAELIGAYANGDGCALKNGALKLSSANAQLMFQWLTILPRLGVAASLACITHNAGKGFSKECTKEWALHIGKQYVAPFAGKCAKVQDVEILRKNNMRLFFGDKLVTPVRAVEENQETLDVYNLEVDEDNSYLVGNLAVHNSKVCYDLSSVSTDWKLYREALDTFDPKKHKYPGLAALEFHKKLKAKDGVGVRGLSITRNDYDEFTKNHMNQILPDGRKVWVYNPYPRFFDISFVFIGADRTAKTMVFIVRKGDTRYVPSAEAGEKVASAAGAFEDVAEEMPKVASIADSAMRHLFGKAASDKLSEISKEIPADVAVPLLEKSEEDLPEKTIQALSAVPKEKALGTTAAMGIVLKPKEFQRITLLRLGKKDMADQLAAANRVFPRVEEVSPCGCEDGGSSFLPALAKMLLPLMADRSALAPFSSTRVVVLKKPAAEPPTSLNTDELRKMSAAYNGYRQELMDMVASAQDVLPSAAPADAEVQKIAAALPEQLFTDLTVAYLKEAHLPPVHASDEVVSTNTQAASVKKASVPSRDTFY